MRRLAPAVVLVLAACGDGGPKLDPTVMWRPIFEMMPGALLRVTGTSARDVYVVGADAEGTGPIALHFDGDRWKRIDTSGLSGDLWWVEIIGPDDVRMVGDDGMVARYTPSTGTIVRQDAPSRERLFGVWGAASNDVWYVGGAVGLNRGVIWRDDGSAIRAPDPLPVATSSAAFFKVYGFAPDAVWMVGQVGRTLFYDGATIVEHRAPLAFPLMGIHGTRADRVFAVGGSSGGVIFAWDGTQWIDESPDRVPQMIGVWATSDDEAYAVGFNGRGYRRSAGAWAPLEEKPPTSHDLHAVWVDPDGGVWAAGGLLSADPPTDGVLVYRGPEIPRTIEP